jgi:hypothetical protein
MICSPRLQQLQSFCIQSRPSQCVGNNTPLENSVCPAQFLPIHHCVTGGLPYETFWRFEISKAPGLQHPKMVKYPNLHRAPVDYKCANVPAVGWPIWRRFGLKLADYFDQPVVVRCSRRLSLEKEIYLSLRFGTNRIVWLRCRIIIVVPFEEVVGTASQHRNFGSRATVVVVPRLIERKNVQRVQSFLSKHI